MGAAGPTGLERLDPRDREYVERLNDDERDVVVSTILRYQRRGELQVGDPLPDLELHRLDGGRTVRLRDLAEGRPLVLAFGSFTWPPFRRRSGDVETFFTTYRDRASFAFVYIAEAHAVDEWQLQANEEEGVLLPQHTTLAERFAAAREGVARLGLTLPVLVDGMDDAVSEAFAAWPERIHVVDAVGRIAFVGGPGPWDFDPSAATVALEEILTRT